MEKWKLALLIFLVLGALSFSRKSMGQSFNVTGNDSVIYLIYSEACPHCHTLMNYLESRHEGVKLVKTTNGAAFKEVLDRYGVKWDFGVPMMFAIAGGNFIGLEGFPTESQDVDGYFMGREFEQQLCQSRGGTPYLVDGSYLFCKLPSGFFLGNEHSVDHLVNTCQETQCVPV